MQIVADHISVMRGEDVILSELSFSVASGEALIVRGANGSGKSTLLRALAGLLPLESGSVSIADPDPDFADSPVADLCHYLGHENAMKPQMTVGENLEFWRNFMGQAHVPVADALGMVGLEGLTDVPFAHLSTGQRRRIAIARLMVSYRPIWLLDEPTAGLDAASEAQFSDLMKVHLEEGGILVAATHVPLGLETAREMVFGAVE